MAQDKQRDISNTLDRVSDLAAVATNLGIGGAILSSVMSARGARPGQRISQFLQSFASNPGAKQEFSKWFGVGLTDEAEVWKICLALLAQREYGLKKIAAINLLLSKMKDDAERDMFRQIVTKIPAGTGEETIDDVTKEGEEKAQRRHYAPRLDTAQDLRVLTLDTIALIVLDGKPESAPDPVVEQKVGSFIYASYIPEKAILDKPAGYAVILHGTEQALALLRGMGLGKESELTKKAKKLWRWAEESYKTQFLEWFDRETRKIDAKLQQEYPDEDIGLLPWIIERMSAGGFETPFSKVTFFGTRIGEKFAKRNRR